MIVPLPRLAMGVEKAQFADVIKGALADHWAEEISRHRGMMFCCRGIPRISFRRTQACNGLKQVRFWITTKALREETPFDDMMVHALVRLRPVNLIEQLFSLLYPTHWRHAQK